jgi:hypothetical protein
MMLSSVLLLLLQKEIDLLEGNITSGYTGLLSGSAYGHPDY